MIKISKLTTPFTHKILTSPVGTLFNNKLFEWVKNKNLPGEFKTAKVGAAVRAEGDNLEAFLSYLDVSPGDLKQDELTRIEKGLSEFREVRREYLDLKERWDEAFWGGKSVVDNDTLVELEEKRRELSEKCRKPTSSLGFLAKKNFTPVVNFEIPSPEETLNNWAKEIEDPGKIYGPPAKSPQIRESATVEGPSGPEYLIKFASPASLMDDTVHARVYEPNKSVKEPPSFVFASGLGMMNDSIQYWPEEEYIGRYLASRGFRVVLIESPWHGRREKEGHYSGEPYVGTAPVGLFTLYSAQTQETGSIIEWLRTKGTSAVGVGGVSLGGIVSEHIAGRCENYPRSARPDMALLVATSNRIKDVVLRSEISKSLGLDEAIEAAGWEEEDLAKLKPLLDPPDDPGISPKRVFGVFGENDTYIPYEYSMEMMKSWGVPDKNVTTWDSGHFGVLTRSIRKTDLQEILIDNMKQVE